MQFSVVTWRQPLDEEVVGEEGLVDDLATVSNESLIDMEKSNFTFYKLRLRMS